MKMNTHKKGKPRQKKTFLQILRVKIKKILTVLFAMGIDKHLDYDQDEIGPETDKEEKRVD